MRRRSLIAARVPLTLAFLALGLLAGAAAAQRWPERAGEDRSDVNKQWRRTLEESDAMLAEGEWKAVHKRADRLLEEMVRRIKGGAAAPFLASATLQRAIARAGLDRRRDAVWDLDMAIALNPEFEQLDLTRYGEAGEKLAGWRVDWWAKPRKPNHPDVTPPKRLKAPEPKYPWAKGRACIDGPIVVVSVIDTEGLLQAPTLPNLDTPVLSFAAMDRLRDWRFKPAQCDGEPVPVMYNLVVNYKIRVCGSPTATAADR